MTQGKRPGSRRNPLPCLECWRQDLNLHSLYGNQALNLARVSPCHVGLEPRGVDLGNVKLPPPRGHSPEKEARKSSSSFCWVCSVVWSFLLSCWNFSMVVSCWSNFSR